MSLSAQASLKVLDGFGRAVRASCLTLAPQSEEEIVALYQRAREEGLTLGFRGAGRSYGDASINSTGVVLDMQGLSRMLDWNPETGIADVQGGVTIEGLWRRTLEDGYWPAVVPGTMAPTLAGCASMNIHGKNNFRVGPFGEHVLDFDLLAPSGEKLLCSRESNPEIFRAALGGMGLLGAITRLRLKLKKVESGYLRVVPTPTRTLEEMFAVFELRRAEVDYLVGSIDCFASGAGLGRGLIHEATYLPASEDPDGPASLHVERQGLPGSILGVPKSSMWRLMKPFTNNVGWRLACWAKYMAGLASGRRSYLQSHVGFAFLLDYVPNWRLAYGLEGFIQVQIFVPAATALQTMKDVLKLGQDRGLPSYLGVLKRHRPDAFLLSHAVDGYSLAMDYRVTAKTRAEVWKLAHDIHQRVLAAGGRFYFAKDAVLTAADVERALGPAALEQFAGLKARLDPHRDRRDQSLPAGPGSQRRVEAAPPGADGGVRSGNASPPGCRKRPSAPLSAGTAPPMFIAPALTLLIVGSSPCSRWPTWRKRARWMRATPMRAPPMPANPTRASSTPAPRCGPPVDLDAGLDLFDAGYFDAGLDDGYTEPRIPTPRASRPPATPTATAPTPSFATRTSASRRRRAGPTAAREASAAGAPPSLRPSWPPCWHRRWC